jgi:5-(carboxyamino)imidazole ribonucleotide mutase
MPKGIPVATVAIDGAENAALLAIQILSVKDENLKIKLREYRKKMAEEINEKDKEIQQKLI